LVLEWFKKEKRPFFKLIYPVKLRLPEKLQPFITNEKVIQVLQHDQLSHPKSQVILDRVTPRDASAFAARYLQAFESKKELSPAIVRNFEALLKQAKVYYFNLLIADEIVGICGFYRQKEAWFLSAGAVLPKHRNRGYHKSMIAARLKILNEIDGTKPINTWAYEGSKSEANLQANGFIPQIKLKESSLAISIN
jgi:hypothetical protein